MRATLQCVRNQREDQIHIYFFYLHCFTILIKHTAHWYLLSLLSSFQLVADLFLSYQGLLEHSWKNLGHLDVWSAFYEKKIQEEINLIILKITKNALPYALNKLYGHVSFEVKQKWKTKKDTASFYLSHLSCLFSIYYFSGIVVGIPVRPRQLQIFQREGENLLLFSC